MPQEAEGARGPRGLALASSRFRVFSLPRWLEWRLGSLLNSFLIGEPLQEAGAPGSCRAGTGQAKAPRLLSSDVAAATEALARDITTDLGNVRSGRRRAAVVARGQTTQWRSYDGASVVAWGSGCFGRDAFNFDLAE